MTEFTVFKDRVRNSFELDWGSQKLYMNFYRALNPGGVLFIGGSKMIFNYREYGFEKLVSCFYRKK